MRLGGGDRWPGLYWDLTGLISSGFAFKQTEAFTVLAVVRFSTAVCASRCVDDSRLADRKNILQL